jgi:hypothetical protein
MEPGGAETPRRVRVEGRDDIGFVIDAGKNIGGFRPMYSVGVPFSSTGAVVYYDAHRVV